jgi:GAF domain-containing protein
MPNARLIQILSRLAAGDTGQLCSVGADVTGTTGAGIMLITRGEPAGSVCTSDEVSLLIEELEYTLGEGPCIDAHRANSPIAEPDLVHPAAMRWTAFAESAVAAGARAVFGFPVALGPVSVGALNLYRDRPGPLTDDQHSDALIVADVAARAILRMQAIAGPGELAPQLASTGNFRFVVHQAAGMISVQLGVPVAEAQLRLRAHAYTTGRAVTDVAADVVARTLRFDALPDQ